MAALGQSILRTEHNGIRTDRDLSLPWETPKRPIDTFKMSLKPEKITPVRLSLDAVEIAPCDFI